MDAESQTYILSFTAPVAAGVPVTAECPPSGGQTTHLLIDRHGRGHRYPCGPLRWVRIIGAARRAFPRDGILPQALRTDVLAMDRPHRGIVNFLAPKFRNPVPHTILNSSLLTRSLRRLITSNLHISNLRSYVHNRIVMKCDEALHHRVLRACESIHV